MKMERRNVSTLFVGSRFAWKAWLSLLLLCVMFQPCSCGIWPVTYENYPRGGKFIDGIKGYLGYSTSGPKPGGPESEPTTAPEKDPQTPIGGSGGSTPGGGSGASPPTGGDTGSPNPGSKPPAGSPQKPAQRQGSGGKETDDKKKKWLKPMLIAVGIGLCIVVMLVVAGSIRKSHRKKKEAKNSPAEIPNSILT